LRKAPANHRRSLFGYAYLVMGDMFRCTHLPCVKSGKSTGALPRLTELALNGPMADQEAARPAIGGNWLDTDSQHARRVLVVHFL
jgi:hypothetical protein